jgi:8-oxo-dGTP pyrophosphatase MutT (NUDIX family)
MPKQLAKPRHATADGTPLRQVAALPYRNNAEGKIEVLLISSRGKKRVIIPKGWQESKKPWKAAEKEAREEAGVVGKIRHSPIGYFEYWKRLRDHFALVEVDVYPLKVEKSLKGWPEKRQRVIKWLTTADAAMLVDEPRLISMLQDFNGRRRKSPRSKRQRKNSEARDHSGNRNTKQSVLDWELGKRGPSGPLSFA